MTDTIVGSSVKDSSGRTGRIVAMTESAVRIAWLEQGSVSHTVDLSRSGVDASIQILTLKEGWQPLAAKTVVTESKFQHASLVAELSSLSEGKGKSAKQKAKDKKIKKLHKAKAAKGTHGKVVAADEKPKEEPKYEPKEAPKKDSEPKDSSEKSTKKEKKISKKDSKSGDGETVKRGSFGKKKHSPLKRQGSMGPGPGGSFGQRHVQKKTQWDCKKDGKYHQSCTLLKRNAQGKLVRTNKKKPITIKKAYKDEYNKEYKAWASRQSHK